DLFRGDFFGSDLGHDGSGLLALLAGGEGEGKAEDAGKPGIHAADPSVRGPGGNIRSNTQGERFTPGTAGATTRRASPRPSRRRATRGRAGERSPAARPRH